MTRLETIETIETIVKLQDRFETIARNAMQEYFNNIERPLSEVYDEICTATDGADDTDNFYTDLGVIMDSFMFRREVSMDIVNTQPLAAWLEVFKPCE